MLTFFATLSNIPSAQDVAALLFSRHPVFTLFLIALLLFVLAELPQRLQRPITRRQIQGQTSLAKTGESSR